MTHKHGRLAAATRARLLPLAMSDVTNDDPAVIGSGPTVPDPTTFAEALRILERCGGVSTYPRSVISHLEAGTGGDVPETPKPGDAAFASASYRVIGSRGDAAGGARPRPRGEGAPRGGPMRCGPPPPLRARRATSLSSTTLRWWARRARQHSGGSTTCV